MKKKKFILLILIALISLSCEKSEVVEVESTETNTVVIEAELISSKNFEGVRITRALPVGINYDIEKAAIKNAYAFLQINGVKVVPLHYKSRGFYGPLHDNLLVSAGDTFELFVTVDGEPIYAKTLIPRKPVVLSTRYNNEGFLEASVKPFAGEAYGAIWVVLEGITKKAHDFYSVDKAPENLSQTVSTRTRKIDDEYLVSSYNGKRSLQIFAFDSQYSDYFNTKVQDDPNGNTVAAGGGQVSWNVIGRNAVGLFMGIAIGDIQSAY